MDVGFRSNGRKEYQAADLDDVEGIGPSSNSVSDSDSQTHIIGNTTKNHNDIDERSRSSNRSRGSNRSLNSNRSRNRISENNYVHEDDSADDNEILRQRMIENTKAAMKKTTYSYKTKKNHLNARPTTSKIKKNRRAGGPHHHAISTNEYDDEDDEYGSQEDEYDNSLEFADDYDDDVGEKRNAFKDVMDDDDLMSDHYDTEEKNMSADTNVPEQQSFRLSSNASSPEKKTQKRLGYRHKKQNNQAKLTVVRYRDPTQVPLEQFTDAEYGLRASHTFTYASADPMDVEYEPEKLRKMEVIDDGNADRIRKKALMFGFAFVFILLLGIGIGVSAGRRQMNQRDEGDDMLVKAPPPDLEDLCDIASISTDIGHEKCEAACLGARCCMASGNESCFIEQEEVCGLYSPCGTLHSETDFDGIDNESSGRVHLPPAPSDLEDICSDESISTTAGFAACLSACHNGQCCLTTNTPEMVASNQYATKPCMDTHKESCEKYMPCTSLQGLTTFGGSSIDRTPVDLVNELCKRGSVKTSKGMNDCENACQARSCCFAKSKTRNCREDNEVWCEEFKACEVLITTEKADNSALETESGSEKNDSATSASNENDNNEWDQSASASSGANSLPGSSGDGEMDDSTNLAKFPADSMCSIENLLFQEGVYQCEFFCADYMCCFSSEPDKSCDNNPQCYKYIACGILIDDNMMSEDDGGNKKLDVDKACSFDSLVTETGRNACSVICESHKCCFTGQCKSDTTCNQYQSCEVIYPSMINSNDDDYQISKQLEPPVDLNEFCSIELITEDDIFYENQCKELCEPALCCIDKDGNCEDQTDFCNKYKACNAVWAVSQWPGAGNNTPSTINDNGVVTTKIANGSSATESPSTSPILSEGLNTNLSQYCETQFIQTDEGMQACVEACASWKCCCSNSNNCFQDFETECTLAMTYCPNC